MCIKSFQSYQEAVLLNCCDHFISVQFSCSVMSNSLRLHEPQHGRPPCSSPTPRVHPNPCPLSWWCHPTISSSVVPFSSCPQSSGSFQMSQLFASGGQSIGQALMGRLVRAQSPKLPLWDIPHAFIHLSLQQSFAECQALCGGRQSGKGKARALSPPGANSPLFPVPLLVCSWWLFYARGCWWASRAILRMK